MQCGTNTWAFFYTSGPRLEYIQPQQEESEMNQPISITRMHPEGYF